MQAPFPCLPLPHPTSSPTHGRRSSVLQDIAQVCKCIEAAGRAGLRGINYNFCVLPHQSTERSAGRGGVSYRTFKLEEYTTSPQDFRPIISPVLPTFSAKRL